MNFNSDSFDEFHSTISASLAHGNAIAKATTPITAVISEQLETFLSRYGCDGSEWMKLNWECKKWLHVNHQWYQLQVLIAYPVS
jgi:hypothetical protein